MNLNAASTLSLTASAAELDRDGGHAQFQKLASISDRSSSSTIAERGGRRTALDQARFYTLARGSAMEAAARWTPAGLTTLTSKVALMFKFTSTVEVDVKVNAN
jgi:hypothetical protein